MTTPVYDIVVVGGGIHGAGVAQAAAAAGHSCLLLEKTGIAHGTSSRSSKLIHGGLRYLETARFSLVRESLAEREILLRVAPDLVHLVPFHIPVYRGTSRGPWTIRAGLSLYACLGGLGRHARFSTVPRRDWGRLDGLDTGGLRAVFRYFDGQTDDAALTRAVVRSAESLGARSECPARFEGACARRYGWRIRYETDGAPRECDALAMVNAAGPWANRILARIDPSPSPLAIDLVQGAHVVIEGTLDAGIYYLEHPRDRRPFFAMPWKGRTLVGTTETAPAAEPDDVRPSEGEISYLEEAVRRYFPGRPIRIVESFAGLRVLPSGPGGAGRRPRDVVLATEGAARPRLVTVYGGKLTGYRATAEKVLALLRPSLPLRRAVADTTTLRLTSG